MDARRNNASGGLLNADHVSRRRRGAHARTHSTRRHARSDTRSNETGCSITNGRVKGWRGLAAGANAWIFGKRPLLTRILPLARSFAATCQSSFTR